jgi:hypothetical protein
MGVIDVGAECECVQGSRREIPARSTPQDLRPALHAPRPAPMHKYTGWVRRLNARGMASAALRPCMRTPQAMHLLAISSDLPGGIPELACSIGASLLVGALKPVCSVNLPEMPPSCVHEAAVVFSKTCCSCVRIRARRGPFCRYRVSSLL